MTRKTILETVMAFVMAYMLFRILPWYELLSRDIFWVSVLAASTLFYIMLELAVDFYVDVQGKRASQQHEEYIKTKIKASALDQAKQDKENFLELKKMIYAGEKAKEGIR